MVCFVDVQDLQVIVLQLKDTVEGLNKSHSSVNCKTCRAQKLEVSEVIGNPIGLLPQLLLACSKPQVQHPLKTANQIV